MRTWRDAVGLLAFLLVLAGLLACTPAYLRFLAHFWGEKSALVAPWREAGP